MYTPSYILNQSEVVIMFNSGAGVEVVENSGHMTVRVFMPWEFIVSIVSVNNSDSHNVDPNGYMILKLST